jgi:hypothetical protein
MPVGVLLVMIGKKEGEKERKKVRRGKLAADQFLWEKTSYGNVRFV